MVPGANDVPVGCCETVPEPTTTSLNVTFVANVAVTLEFAFNTNVQVGWYVLAHGPLQLINDEFAFGVAVNVIVELFGSDVPVGDCVTVPGPVVVRAKLYFVTVVTPVPVKLRAIPEPLSGEFV